MTIKLGTTSINKLYVGTTAINKVYQGTNLVFGVVTFTYPAIGGSVESSDMATVFAEISFNSASTITAASSGASGGGLTNSNWAIGSGAGAAHWVRFTQTASSGFGTESGDTSGVWLALTSNRTKRVTRSGVGTFSRTYTVDISTDASGSIIVSTGSVMLFAEFDVA